MAEGTRVFLRGIFLIIVSQFCLIILTNLILLRCEKEFTESLYIYTYQLCIHQYIFIIYNHWILPSYIVNDCPFKNHEFPLVQPSSYWGTSMTWETPITLLRVIPTMTFQDLHLDKYSTYSDNLSNIS